MNELIEQVRTIDVEAAEFLETQLGNFNYEWTNCPSLSALMLWENTPQGWEYWSNINRQLEG